jgi:CDP-diacylglycerol---serine O-phosphatidyltransferase
MQIKNHIPNTITLLNLLAGIFSIYFGMQGDLLFSAYCIFVAAIFDFFDGFTARMLHAKSDIGEQLDSLADVISFGVAPGFIMFHMINLSLGSDFESNLPFFGFIIPLFSALRLAKFNVDENQTDSFVGVPTPTVALLVASFPIIILQTYAENPGLYYNIILNPYFLVGIAVAFSLLMVSPLPMFALKFKSFRWKSNQVQYIFVVVSLSIVVFLGFAAVPIIVLFYLLLSISISIICTTSKKTTL